MINLYNQVPSIYTSASRDFQYLSWLYNIVLNSVKHNIDDIYKIPSVAEDAKLTELLAMTLGFKVKRHYDQKQLIALVAILHSALRYKGTEKAVLMAAEALVKAMGSLGEAEVDVDGTEIKVTLPKDLIDITLFFDVLDYILPAGMTCRVVRKNKKPKKAKDIQVRYSDEINRLIVDDLAWTTKYDADQAEYINQDTGLSGLYNISDSHYDYLNTANIRADGTLNAGLLANTIIPVLSGSTTVEVEESLFVDTLYSAEDDNTIKLLKAHSAENPESGVVLKAKRDVQEL